MATTWQRPPFRAGWIPFALFVLAFGLRLALLNQYVHSPYFLPIGWDPKGYDLWAQQLAAGHFSTGEAFHQPPLYPLLLAGLYSLFGRDFYLVFLVQALMDSLTVVLLYALGCDRFNRRVGVLAALGWCGYGAAAFHTVKLLSETAAVLLSVGLVWALYRTTARPTRARWLGNGLLLGLCVAIKPNLILLLPGVWLHLALAAPVAGTLWRRAQAAALVTLGTVLLVAPIVAYNYATEGDFIFVSWNSGGNLYSGNNAEAIGLPTPLPGVSEDPLWRAVDERAAAGRALGLAHPSAGTVSRYWARQARAFMAAHPGQFARLLLQKFRLAISGMENSHMYYFNHERDRFTPALWLFPLNFYWLFPPAVLGLLLALAEWRRHLLLLASLAATFSTLILFYVLTRFRLPAEALLMLFAAYGLGRLRPGAPAFPRSLALFAFLAAASAAMYMQDRNRFPGRATNIEYNLAEHLFDGGQVDEAERTYWRAARLNPHNVYPGLGLCKVQLARHRPEVAAAAYRALLPFLDADARRDAWRDEELAALRPAMRRIEAESAGAAH